MSTIGKTATIKVTYDAKTTGFKPIVGTGIVLCVDPQAKVGTKHFMEKGKNGLKTWDGDDTGCAKFYQDSDVTQVKAYVGGDDTIIYFYASDDKGAAINYDKYKAESADSRTVSVSDVREVGRYAAISVSGVKAGSANVNVTCTSNGKDAAYTVSVKVEDIKLSNVTVTGSRGNSMSDSQDAENINALEAKAFSGDLDITDSVAWSWSLSSPYWKGDAHNGSTSITNSTTKKETFTPGRGESGTFKVTATAEYNGVTQKKEFNISVSNLKVHEKATLNQSTGVFTPGSDKTGTVANSQVEYDIEWSADWDATSASKNVGHARLFAKEKGTGLFVGYVDGETNSVGAGETGYGLYEKGCLEAGDFASGTFASASYTTVTFDGKQIAPFASGQSGAAFGDKYNLYGVKKLSKTNVTGTWVTADFTFNKDSLTVVSNDASYDEEVAKAAKLNIQVYAWTSGGSGFVKLLGEAGKSKEVTRGARVPKVTVTNDRIKDLDATGVTNVLVADVDLNGATTHASITGISNGFTYTAGKSGAEGTWTPKDVIAKETSFDVGYAVVKDGDVSWLINIGTMFSKN